MRNRIRFRPRMSFTICTRNCIPSMYCGSSIPPIGECIRRPRRSLSSRTLPPCRGFSDPDAGLLSEALPINIRDSIFRGVSMPEPLKMIYEKDAPLDALQGKTVAFFGFGSRGHPHGLTLRDSGVKVIVANRKDSPNGKLAAQNGFEPLS